MIITHNGTILTNDGVSTIRKSLDNTQFVIKWQEGYVPTFISDGTVVPVQEYDHHAILELMSTSAWSDPDPII